MAKLNLTRLATALAASLVVLLMGLVSPGLTQAQAAAAQAPTPGTNVRSLPTTEKVVALTFDDAWIDSDLVGILAALKAGGVKATFFPTGAGVANSPDLARQIAADGNDVGSHSYVHIALSAQSNPNIQQQLQMTERAFCSAGLKDPAPLLRGPYGRVSPRALRVLRSEGYVSIKWTFNAGDDTVGITPAQVVNHVVHSVRPGAIILMHTRNPVAPAALPEIISRLKSMGYRFVLLRDVLFPSARALARYEEDSPLLAYSGSWVSRFSPSEYGGAATLTSAKGSEVEASFRGTSFEWLGLEGPDLGKALVSVDGGRAREVDLYSPRYAHRCRIFAVSGLGDTSHSVTITCAGSKNSASRGYAIDVDAVRVAGTLTSTTARTH